MKSSNKIIFLSMILSNILFADAIADDKKEQSMGNILSSMSESSTEGRSTDSTVSLPNKTRKMTGYDEALSLTFFQSSELPNKTQVGVDSAMAFNVEGYQNELNKIARDKAEKERLEAEEEYKASHEIKYVSGYCMLNKQIVVERLATYAYLDCDFSGTIGRGQLAISLVPEFYAKALIGNPLYLITKDNDRLPVHNGVVMTKDKNSVNLANVVNDRLVQKIAITSGYKGLGVVAQQAQAFLDAKSAARYQTSSTVTGGDNPVVVQDTKVLQPRIEDYFATALVQTVGEIAKIVGENLVENLPYTFQAHKGSVFYVDLELTGSSNMEGYKISEPNIVKQEPTFKDGREVPVAHEVIPVMNNLSNQGGRTIPGSPSKTEYNKQKSGSPQPGGRPSTILIPSLNTKK
jgi:hypothetical protein